MRLTINLDDELSAVAKSLAQTRDVSISVAVNTLLRRAVEPEWIEPIPAPMAADAGGWPVARGRRREGAG